MSESLQSADSEAWRPRPYVVHQWRRESQDTVTLHLAPAASMPIEPTLHKPRPGQFNMLYLFGKGEAPISISGISRRTGHIHHTVKAAGSLTRALTELKIGDTVGLRGPFGNGWPLHAAHGRNLLLIAGGIGMAPIRAAMRSVMRHPDRYGRIDLIYGSRNPQDILFGQQLQRWHANKLANVHLTVDHSDANWNGSVGFVTSLLDNLEMESARTTAFLCGPEIMMRHSMGKLLNAGVAPEEIHMSIERNMRCAIGVCGHCQWGADFICQQGPVFTAEQARKRLQVREL